MIGPVAYLDIILVVVALISGFLSLYRGLTRELLAISSWGAGLLAGLAVWVFQKQLAQDLASQLGQNATAVHIVLAAIVGVIVLIAVHLITARLSDFILESRVGMVDRIFGFVFGLARGFILVLIPFMAHDAFLPPASQLPWITQAQVAPTMKSVGNTLKTVLIRLPDLFSDPDEAREG